MSKMSDMAATIEELRTAMLKQRIIDRYLRDLAKEYELVQYIGIAADEPQRIHEFRYPLVEWGMTETDCLAYCK